MRFFRAAYLGASALLLLAATPARGQEEQWDVWVNTLQCADTRGTWLTASNAHPGYGWSKMPGAPTGIQFLEAHANVDAMRILGPFQNYCCKFVLWRDSRSGVQALVRENDVAPAPWMPDSVPMCAETAILQSGIADPMSALTLWLSSVPATAVVTAGGVVSATSDAIVLPTNPPTVIAPSGPINTLGGITGEPH
jgi:hypothetical protein